jgi:hypothetical protein
LFLLTGERFLARPVRYYGEHARRHPVAEWSAHHDARIHAEHFPGQLG